MTDPLTGALNRRTLFDVGAKLLAAARADRSPLAVIILDIDHFKRINDTHGHLAGDVVLRRFVEVVEACLGEQDLLTRYGGEEFCVLLPGASLEAAHAVAERLRTSVEAGEFAVDDTVRLHVTSSAGVASCAGAGETSLSTLLRRADEALYAAKRDGRNRVVLAPAGSSAA